MSKIIYQAEKNRAYIKLLEGVEMAELNELLMVLKGEILLKNNNYILDLEEITHLNSIMLNIIAYITKNISENNRISIVNVSPFCAEIMHATGLAKYISDIYSYDPFSAVA